ncbi:MAG: GTP-binding protein [Crenarchaeota archaeon]|nr:GTP-binding protein [Thermoproteota archaeon]
MQSREAREQPPWLQRQIEAQKLTALVARLKRLYIYTAEEIVAAVGEHYRKLRPRRPGKQGRLEFEVKRLETVYNVAVSRLKRALEMPRPEEMSTFHRLLVDGFVGLDRYTEALARIRASIRVIKNIWDEYRLLIVSAETTREAARLRREGSGRILSVVRRRRRDLELLRSVRIELLKTHVISEGLPVVVVAGIPSVGKSTIVSRLSTAEPEVAAYPFTTKTVIVGKVSDMFPAFYMVDTPGILERPWHMHNQIERKALAALAALPDVVLFLLDASPERIQDIDEQVELLRDVARRMIKGYERGLIIAVNKVDLSGPHAAKDAGSKAVEAIREEGLENRLCSQPLLISAAQGAGLQELKAALRGCVKRYATWLFSR